MEYLEYPVLTGLFMQVASWLTLTRSSDPVQQREQMYWMVNAGMLMVCAVILAVCVARTHRRRPWDGLLVALAPALALTATINWDLLAVALTAAAMLMWSRGRSVAFGVLIGLATAAKLYPVLLLGPLLVLCWRAGKWREFGTALLGAGRGLAGGQPAGDAVRARGVEEVLHLQPGTADRLRLVLADHRPAHRPIPSTWER